jgi:hypothetical protein
MKKITLLAMSFIMALTVKAQYGTDVTNLLTNPDFESGTTGWEGTFATQNSAVPNFSGTFLERWAGYHALDQSTGVYKEGDIEYYKLIDLFCSQTISVENGFYVLEAYVNAVQQNLGSLNPVTGVLLFANDDVTSCATGNGQPELFKVETTVTDGSLTVGLRTENTTANWIAWDNLKLVRYTGATIDEAKVLWMKDEMNPLKENLELLIKNPMSAELRDAINESFDAIEIVTTFVAAEALWNTMKAQVEEAEACVAAYEQLILRIDEMYEEAKNGDNTYDLFNAAHAAHVKYNGEILSAAEALAEIEVLNQAVYDYQMSIADGSIAFDVTERYITNPTLRENSNGWSGSKPGLEHQVMEFFNCDFDIYQEFTGIPNGKYVVKVQGFYRQAGNDSGAAYAAGTEDITAQLYANSESTPLLSLYTYKASEMGGITEEVLNDYVNMRYSTNIAFNTMNTLTDQNYYEENAVTVIVMDGNLKIGLRNSGHKSNSWCAFRDFKLFYYGNFPGLNLYEKIEKARDMMNECLDEIPSAMRKDMESFLNKNEKYTESGYSEEDVNAVILELEAKWNKVLVAIDLFVALKAKVADIKTNLLPLKFPGEDDLWDLVEEAEELFDPECEVNTYDVLLDLEARLNEGIVAYFVSQEATEDDPADFTYFVPNPNFEQKGGWTWSVVGGDSDQWNGGCRPNEEGGANRQGVNLWGWGITSVDVHQTLTGLPNGLYKVSAELITQNNYATDQHVYATGVTTTESDYLTVAGWDTYEWTTLTTNDFAIVIDGTLTIGAAASIGGTNSEGWFQATNFKLYYCGKVSDLLMMGDVNGDGFHTMSDVVMMVNSILGIAQENFYAELADVNGDGDTTIGDVISILRMVLTSELPKDDARSIARRGASRVADTPMLGVDECVMIADNRMVMPVSLNNTCEYTAFQMDVVLPAGVELMKATLSDRAKNSHSIAWNKLSDGSTRIVAYALNNATFKGSEGTLLNFELATTSGVADEELTLTNAFFTTPSGAEDRASALSVPMRVGTTGMESVEVSEVRVYGVEGAVVVEGNVNTTLKVYAITGKFIKQVQVAVGNTTIELPAGVYVINGNKVIVK